MKLFGAVMEALAKTTDVYHKAGPYDHTLFVTPGTESDASFFKNEHDGTNKVFKIRFERGKANVPAQLADYLIDKELVEIEPVTASHIIRPQAFAPEERRRVHRVLGA